MIAGLGAASKLAREEADELLVHMLALKLRLILRLQEKLSSVKVLSCTALSFLVFTVFYTVEVHCHTREQALH